MFCAEASPLGKEELINTNPAAERRARCPGRMPAWHLLPLPEWAGKWELLWGDQPGQRQEEPPGSPAPGPATRQVAPGWGGQSARDIANTERFKSWKGICFCPHALLQSPQNDAIRADGGVMATGVLAKVLPEGHVRSAGVCWALASCPYMKVMSRLQTAELPHGEAVFHYSIPWGVWDYSWTNWRKSTLQARL